MPSYFPENNTPQVFDPQERSLAKIANLIAGGGVGGRWLDTISDLKAETNHVGIRNIRGYSSPTDGVELPPYYADLDDSSSSDDGFSVIVADDGTRWKPVFVPPILDARLFGAKIDGTQDDHPFAQNAANYADANELILWVPPTSSTLDISEKLTLGTGAKGFIMDSPIRYTGSANEPAVEIGQAGVANTRDIYRVWVVRSSQSDWSSEDSIGCRFYNILWGNIQIVRAIGFTIGVQVFSDTSGSVHNNIYGGDIINNKYGIDLTGEDGGWVNENTFYGQSFQCTSGVNSGESRYGVRINTIDPGTGYTNHNNNVFYHPSFQIRESEASPGEAVPILIEYGNNNYFYDIRDENNSDTTIRNNNDAGPNYVNIGRATGKTPGLDFAGRAHSVLLSDDDSINIPTTIFDSGPVHLNACFADGSTDIHVPNVHIGISGSTTAFSSINALTINSNNLQYGSSRALGVFVDTSRAKRFLVTKDINADNGGRLYVVAFNSGGSILDDQDQNHPYVFGPGGALDFSSNYGGSYVVQSDSDDSHLFQVHDDVKHVRVLLAGGSSDMQIRQFRIHNISYQTARDNDAAVWVGYEEIVKGGNIGSAAPTSGTWERGRIVWNEEPSTSGKIGWVCVTSGTPGTWKQFGAIDA